MLLEDSGQKLTLERKINVCPPTLLGGKLCLKSWHHKRFTDKKKTKAKQTNKQNAVSMKELNNDH